MERAFPIAFLPQDHALAIAILSYDGAVNFGLIGDHDALPDLKLIADGIAGEIDRLDALAATVTAERASAPVQAG
jgi:hypothetical protein